MTLVTCARMMDGLVYACEGDGRDRNVNAHSNTDVYVGCVQVTDEREYTVYSYSFMTSLLSVHVRGNK